MTAAQDATPTAEGVTVEVLGTGLPTAAPDRMLALARVTFAPGFTLQAHTHPGALIGHFEAGAFGFRVLEGESARVVRAGGAGTPAAADPMAGEPVPPGTEVIFNPGPRARDWRRLEDPNLPRPPATRPTGFETRPHQEGG
jgi:hypothetical protein